MIDYIADTRVNYRTTKTKITSSDDVFEELKDYSTARQEHFIVCYLDASNCILENRIITIGTLNQSLVHPREVFAPAIEKRASSIIIAHNHPSSILKSSDEDIQVTKRLKDASKILGIELLDHIILTENGFLSFRNEDIL
ncbi:JAB domain-containing protein [Malaciobacter marinus]|uniref:JAB domain-containing protein n=1 Tax=Malaciobacter marinus TaxID=505249 RepID=UPI003AFFF5AC